MSNPTLPQVGFNDSILTETTYAGTPVVLQPNSGVFSSNTIGGQPEEQVDGQPWYLDDSSSNAFVVSIANGGGELSLNFAALYAQGYSLTFDVADPSLVYLVGGHGEIILNGFDPSAYQLAATPTGYVGQLIASQLTVSLPSAQDAGLSNVVLNNLTYVNTSSDAATSAQISFQALQTPGYGAVFSPDGYSAGPTSFTETVNVLPLPAVVTETAMVTSGGTVSGTAGTSGTGALAGDSDANAGYSLNVSAIAGGTLGSALHGTYGDLTLNTDGSFSYTAGATSTEIANIAAASGQVTDAFTYSVSDSHGGVTPSTLDINLDATKPSISSIGFSTSSGELGAGAHETITLSLGDTSAIHIAGNGPTLTLNDGGTATYDAAASTSTSLVFDYQVASTDTDVASLAVSSVNLNGTTLTNASDVATGTSLSVTGVTQSGPQINTTTPIAIVLDGSNGTGGFAGLVMDAAGDLFGADGAGEIFEIKDSNGSYASTPTVLYTFSPPLGLSSLIIDSAGDLFGASGQSGGAAFELADSNGSYASAPTFVFSSNGGLATNVYLAMDTAGDLFIAGAVDHYGNAYSNFYGQPANIFLPTVDGATGVIVDPAGDLFIASPGEIDEEPFFPTGGSLYQEYDQGSNSTVVSLTGGSIGSGNFTGLTLGPGGYIFATTSQGGLNGHGTVFEIGNSGYTRGVTVLYNLTAADGTLGAYLTVDAAGDIFGTTIDGGAYGEGSVFELKFANGGYTHITLHDFTGGADGASPVGSAVVNAAGDLFVTTNQGGNGGNGTVVELFNTGWSNTPAIAAISENPSGGVIGPNARVTFTLSTTAPVTVDTAKGMPTLSLNDNGTATYDAADSTSTSLVFNYTLTGNYTDVASLQATLLNLNGATIDSLTGVAANVSLTGLSQSGPQIDLVQVKGGFAAPSSGTYGAGETMSLFVQFNKDVTVTGSGITLSLNDGGTATLDVADTALWQQNGYVVFDYHVAPTDHDVTSLAVTGGALNGGTILDSLGGEAQFTGTLPTFSNIEIDTGIACYGRGTLIETARGQQQEVETLNIGDKVRTASGALRPIKWIGRRSYAGRFVMGRNDILPICIKAGALADNVPARDLWVSPNHAMYLNGVLIEAKDLINGVSIVQAERVESVEYFHIELDTHDVIIAEGALAETFIDDDSRGMFHNVEDYHTLYEEEHAAPAHYCAPRLNEGYEIEAVRQRLALRAGLLRGADAPRQGSPQIGALRGYIDRIRATSIAGWAQSIDALEAPVCLDILAGGKLIGRVLASTYRDDLKRAGLGSGRHAFQFTPPAGFVFAPDSIEVRRSLDGASLESSKPASCASPDLAPHRRVARG